METTIEWDDFQRIDMRVGTIVSAETFAKARKPAYILQIDFGPDIGTLKSSAQITDLYTSDSLLGKQVMGVVNFPKKQVGPIMSECLITGFVYDDGTVILAVPDKPAKNGTRLA